MRRHLVRCCLALLATASGGGCQSLSTGKLAFRPPKATFAKPDRASEGKNVRTETDTEELADSTPASPSGKAAADSLAGGSRSPSPKTKSRPPLDPATEILIENELKDATEEERAEWLARFKEMSSRQITAALCERRSALAADFNRDRRHALEAPDPREASEVGPASSTPDSDSIALASASRSDPRRPSNATQTAQNGQPASDPWDIEPHSPDEASADPPVEPSPRSSDGSSSAPEVDIWGDPIPRRPARPRDTVPAPQNMAAVTPVSALRFTDDPVATQVKPADDAVEAQRGTSETPLQPDPPTAMSPPVATSLPPASPVHLPPLAVPRIEPTRGSRLADWDPTRLFGRRRAAEPAVAPETLDREASLPPYNPGGASSQVDRSEVAVADLGAGSAFTGRRIDPQAPYTMDELRRLISLMEAEAEASLPGASPELQRQYLRRHLNLRLLRLVADQRAEAQEPIPGLDPVDQEFWNSVFWGLSNYLDHEGIVDPTERAALTAAQFQAAARHLQSTARLELKNVAFCHRIDGFGSFERFERDEFQAGVPVLVYAEVRNFSSEPTTDGRFLTTLRSTVEIVRIGVQQVPVDRMTFEPTEDRSRSPRTDFYNSYKINLPTNLPPGPYQLRLTVEDESSGKIATQTMNFSIR